MSKELRYNCSLLGIITDATLYRLTNHHNLTLAEVQTKVNTIVDLIVNKGLTLNELEYHRLFLNPVGIGIASDITVKKRKYVRKNITENTEEGLTIKDLPNIKTGMVVITDRLKPKTSSQYVVGQITKTSIKIINKNGVTINQYSHNDFYSKFKDSRWGIINPTEDQIKFFNKVNNVITSDKFKFENNEVRAKFVNAGYFTIIANPTANCQLCVVGYGQALISNSSDILKQLKEVSKYLSKYLILMDIKDCYFKDLQIIFGDNFTKSSFVKIHTPYESTNGSSMHLLMFNTKNL